MILHFPLTVLTVSLAPLKDQSIPANSAEHMGPVVQSIVSLTNSLVSDLLSLLICIKSRELMLFAEKCEELLPFQSSSHFFRQKLVAFLCIIHSEF